MLAGSQLGVLHFLLFLFSYHSQLYLPFDHLLLSFLSDHLYPPTLSNSSFLFEASLFTVRDFV